MTGLGLLADAIQSLLRSRAVVVAYVLVCGGSELLLRLLLDLLPQSTPDFEGPPWVRLVSLAVFVTHAVIVSSAQAVFFARLGKDIDKPLWKCENDREAFRRFFSIWLVLNMLVLLLFRLLAIALRQELESVGVLLQLSMMMAFALFYPLGVSAMYAKVAHWRNVPAAIRTISSQLGLSLVVMFLGFFSFTYMLSAQTLLGSEPGAIAPLLFISVPMTVLDCLSFAAMWRVCMIHRDSPPEEDLDFY